MIVNNNVTLNNIEFIIILAFLSILNGLSYQCIPKDKSSCITGLDECIIGGREAEMNAYPFMVRLMITFESGEKALCGGSLITTQWVMTAAHCVFISETRMQTNNITIHLGDHHFYFDDPQEQKIKGHIVKVHANYISKEENDIALIKLETKAKLNRVVQRGCLSPHGREYVGKMAMAIGWGLTSLDSLYVSPVLKETIVPVLPGYKCFMNEVESKEKICTGFRKTLGQDTVFMGDSGGPLFVKNSKGRSTIIGIASVVAVFPYIKPTILFAIFTKVSFHIAWIKSNVHPEEICINKN